MKFLLRLLLAYLFAIQALGSNAQYLTDTSKTNLLFEHFSNQYYFNIDNINHNFYNKLNELGTVATLIQYQTPCEGFDPIWDQNVTDANVRRLVYGFSTSNQLLINGSSAGYSSELDTVGLGLLSNASPKFQLFIDNLSISGGNISATASLKALEDMPFDNYILHAVVIEQKVANTNNFERQHIMRKMLPNVAGYEYTDSWTANDSVAVALQWTLPSYISNPVGLVIFIQNSNTKEVYQSLSTFSQVQPSQFVPKAVIKGNVFDDANLTCINEGEGNIRDWMARLQGDGELLYSIVNASGDYSFVVDSGSYQIDVLPPNPYWQTCPAAQVVTVDNNDTTEINFAAQALLNTPALTVDLSTAFLRQCLDSRYYVNYCNKGTTPAPNAVVQVAFDDNLVVNNSSIAAAVLPTGEYEFSVGTVDPGDCGSFWVDVTVDCNTSVTEETHCSEAKISSDSATLMLPNPSWDGADIKAEIECTTDSVRFLLRNIGIGPMSTTSDFIVTEDEIMLNVGGIPPMQPGGVTTFALPAIGATYHIEANQTTGHPYGPVVATAYEGCGTSPFVPGFVNQYPLGENNPATALDCRQNVIATLPYGRLGFPKGYGPHHLIDKNTKLDYLVRFQNQGSQTIQTVVIEDQISPYLDLESLTIGASSHPFQVQIIGERTVRFIFENINLPPGGTNSTASNGFVKFSINQVANNPNGTLIDDGAIIYMDFNSPIYTNNTEHEVGENFIQTQFIGSMLVNDHSIDIYPNPFGNTTTIKINEEEAFDHVVFRLFDRHGRELRILHIENQTEFQFNRQDLSRGIYFYRIEGNGRLIDVGKLSVH